MKVALYARVSKADTQNPQNQLDELRRWAAQTGAHVHGEFVDEISSRDTRPQKEEVLRLLRNGVIEGVVFWSLDRWGRDMSELVLEFQEAAQRGWTLLSLHEGLRLDTAAGQLHAHLLAAFANFERERFRERTKAGLERVRAQGKRLGRKPANFDLQQALRLRQEGLSYPQIGLKLGVSTSVAFRALKTASFPKTLAENPTGSVEVALTIPKSGDLDKGDADG